MPRRIGVNLINYQLQRIDFLHSLEVFSFCRGKKKQKPLVAASTLYFTLGRFVHLAAFHCAWPRCCFRRPRLFLTVFHARYRRDFGPLIIALGIVLFSAVKKGGQRAYPTHWGAFRVRGVSGAATAGLQLVPYKAFWLLGTGERNSYSQIPS